MKNVFILLLLGTASLFCIACSGENSVLTDGDAVLLQPGVHAGATLASTRSMINDVGTGADRISTIGIYLAAADGSLYPGSNARSDLHESDLRCQLDEQSFYLRQPCKSNGLCLGTRHDSLEERWRQW